ncbi:MBOAT, membrane-bound O-acyltransferase family-domain-containing protein [Piptocephalis cylindrospora]|uniref:Lysophospholipid acyltransferase 5 n=1 Tax=Piptocephalis cylindrospora TaxID=1907219 RepID=A0A4V1IY46_9FUNG|nr:MBOAT, membrane-bound O-acyltransferase family-domain-containing protein [Piptocephalis cylindrospora]|eukprot:RKP13289.1 MBOAT, membrane-bound O-acyltransferase family-domain-containing protein [Piptocephalis cylindrospora]
MALVETLSAATGVPIPALKLLLTVLFGYPVAAFYSIVLLPNHRFSKSLAPHLRNAYYLLTGLGLSYFYCGTDTYHSLLTVLGTYGLTWVTHLTGTRRKALGPLVLVFNLAYLLIGYANTMTEGYDINWTMSQCILCLRLTGFGWDIADGVPTPPGKIKEAQGPSTGLASFPDDSPLGDIPSLVRILGWAYHPTSFLVGPQFAYRLYEKSLHNEHLPSPDTIPAGRKERILQCLALGVFYLGFNQILGSAFPTSFLPADEFRQEYSLGGRALYMWIAGKAAMSKYLGIWKLNEGACILTGIGYGGPRKLESGAAPAHWDGLSNVDIQGYEMATSLTQIIASFNINTNHWVKRYVFKRLRFLGSKNLSSLGALLYLAVWHGYHANYFYVFAMEFMDIEAERRGRRILAPLTQKIFAAQGGSKVGKMAFHVSWWVLTTSALYYAMSAFDLPGFTRGLRAWSSIHYLGFWAVVAIFVADVLIQRQRKGLSRGGDGGRHGAGGKQKGE